MRAKKSLGQYFLRCRWVAQALIKAAGLTRKDTVLEIGPGTGILTRALASAAGQLIAVEKDERLAAALAVTLNQEGIKNVEIVSADILSNLRTYEVRKLENYKVVANIPYYLTSRLLRLLLENGPRPELIVLTVQKEVAERITAKPPHMNLLALSVQAFGKAELIKKVPADCFSPAPKVDSAIIKISNISDHFFLKNGTDKAEFFTIIRRAFSQKRKLLLNTLFVQHSVSHKTEIAAALKRIGLSEKARPAELSLRHWAMLIKSIYPHT